MIKIFKICTHYKAFTLHRSIKHALSRYPPSHSPIYFDHTNISISYVLDKIKMLDDTKNGSCLFKADSQCISFLFCTNYVLIGVLRHKGRFGLDYTLVS